MRTLALVACIALAACEVSPSYPTATVVIAQDGALTLQGKPVSDRDLVKELTAIRERAPTVMLIVRTEGSTFNPRENVVIRAAAKAGIKTTSTGEYVEPERERKSR